MNLPTRTLVLLLTFFVVSFTSCKSVRKTRMRSGSGEGSDTLSSRLLDTSEGKKSFFDKRDGGFMGKFRTKEAHIGGRDLASEFISGKDEFSKKNFAGSKDVPRFAGQQFYGGRTQAALPQRVEKTSSKYSGQQLRGTVGEARGWSGAKDSFGTQATRDAAAAQAKPLPKPITQQSQESDIGVGVLRGILNKGS